MNEQSTIHEYTYRLDFYWKAIAFYAIATILYGVGRAMYSGAVGNGTITVTLFDPLLVLMLLFVLGSSLTLFVTWFMKRSLCITHNAIIFKNRFRERTFFFADFQRMLIGKEKTIKVRGVYKLVKIRLSTRRWLLRIRTSSYNNEQQLVQQMIDIKRSLAKRA